MSEQEWHLDKRVPIALIFALLVQTGGAVWWASTLQGRVGTVERDVGRLERQQGATSLAAQAQAVQLGRIEENMGAIRADIGRLLAVLERDQRP